MVNYAFDAILSFVFVYEQATAGLCDSRLYIDVEMYIYYQLM